MVLFLGGFDHMEVDEQDREQVDTESDSGGTRGHTLRHLEPQCDACTRSILKERDKKERESVLASKSTVVQPQAAHEEHEATRLSAKEAAAEATANVTASLHRWQAAETSRR